MKLWIVGKFTFGPTESQKDFWEFAGVFDNEQQAIDACKTELFFVGPANLNELLPEERIEWPGCYYPKAKQTESAAATI